MNLNVAKALVCRVRIQRFDSWLRLSLQGVGGMSTKERGTVKWFNDAKGFGFINHKSGKDVFVHYSVIEAEGFKTLKDGELVDYELSEGPKGLNAAVVYRLTQPSTTESTAAAPNQEAPTGLAEQVEVIKTEDAAEAEETRVAEVATQQASTPATEIITADEPQKTADELSSH